MKQLMVLCAPPGAGKTTMAELFQLLGYLRINQDDQGKKEHLELFKDALENEEPNIIIDRMNFNKEQRQRYISLAKEKNYEVIINVLHENYQTCLDRMLKREDHPTIKDEKSARSALKTFFTKYERPTPDEADKIVFNYPNANKEIAIVTDIDNTLSNTSHREEFVDRSKGKPNWKAFFDKMGEDNCNEWCKSILNSSPYKKVIVSARPDSYKQITETWLSKHNVNYDALYMRRRDDHRKDSIVKEQILDFELKTRYNILFWLDDRKQVIDAIRNRDIIVLDCAGEKGNF